MDSKTPLTDRIIEKSQFQNRLVMLITHARDLETLANELADALKDYVSRCQSCGGVGWYARQINEEEVAQEQCQWCDHGLIKLARFNAMREEAK